MVKRALFWLLWPGLFVYFQFSRRARVLLLDEGSILLVKDRFLLWFGQEQWALPGGGLHLFESPKSAAAREAKEELGVDIDESQLKVIGQSRIGSHGLQYHAYFLTARVSKTVELQLKTSEIADARWCDSSTLDPKTLKAEVREGLRLLANKS